MAIEVTLSKDAFGELLATDKKLAEEYTADEKNEGSFILSTAIGYESPEAIHGLKQALDRERDNARAGNAHSKEAERLQAELDALKSKGADTDTLAGQVTNLQEQLAALTGTLASERSQRAIAESVATSRGNLGLTEYLQRRVAVDKDTGKAGAIDPETGDAILNADGQPLSVAQYVAALRESATNGDDSIAALFIGTQSSGGGTPPGGGGSGGVHKPAPGTLRRSKLSPREKIDFLRAHGDAAFQNLPY